MHVVPHQTMTVVGTNYNTSLNSSSGIEYLSSKHRLLGFTPVLHEPGIVAYTCNLSIRELGTGGAEVQSHLGIYTKVETSLGYMRPCLIKKRFSEF